MSRRNQQIPYRTYTYEVMLFFITLVLRLVLIGYYSSSFGGIEQNVVYGIQRVIAGQPLYQNPAAGAYAIMQYTPLYYYFIGGIARATHISAANVQSIYTLCRTAALLFDLLAVVVAALIIRRWNYSRKAALAFATPLLVVLTTHYYTRGDSMHLFLFVTAIYVYTRYQNKRRIQYILLAALLSAGCIMVKQSGILVAGIIGFRLLFADRKYLAALLYLLCTAGFAYVIAASCVQGDWQHFYQNTYLGLKNGTDVSFLYQIFISQFFLDMVPCYVLGGVMAWLAVRRVEDAQFRIIATGAALSFLFAITTGLKIGSSNNYFTEFLFFVILAVPYLLQHQAGEIGLFRVSGKAVTVRWFTYAALFILVTSKTMGLFTAVCLDKSLKNNRAEYEKEVALRNYMAKHMPLYAGEYIFFTDRLFFDNLFMQQAIMPGKDVVMLVYANSHTTYDYTAFIKGMNNGLIKYIITDSTKKDINEWAHIIPFIHFDTNRFRLVSSGNGYSIYAYSAAF